jgi:hypothetical protein
VPATSVDPFGDLHRAPVHGAAFGNRGILHDDAREVVTLWRSAAWITCLLEFGGRRREVLPPGGYTGLFFRDEATALAAGHRPCFECRRADAVAFRDAVGAARAGDLDRALHAERLPAYSRTSPSSPLRARRRLHDPGGDPLPDGVVVLDDAGPAVVVDGALRDWSWGPLGDPRDAVGAVRVLTPPTSVAALRAGYRPTTLPLVA